MNISRISSLAVSVLSILIVYNLPETSDYTLVGLPILCIITLYVLLVLSEIQITQCNQIAEYNNIIIDNDKELITKQNELIKAYEDSSGVKNEIILNHESHHNKQQDLMNEMSDAVIDMKHSSDKLKDLFNTVIEFKGSPQELYDYVKSIETP
jgi:hypothetical protein